MISRDRYICRVTRGRTEDRDLISHSRLMRRESTSMSLYTSCRKGGRGEGYLMHIGAQLFNSLPSPTGFEVVCPTLFLLLSIFSSIPDTVSFPPFAFSHFHFSLRGTNCSPVSLAFGILPRFLFFFISLVIYIPFLATPRRD